MFEENNDSAVMRTPGRVFLHQTGAIVYTLPSSNSDVVVRLNEGNPLDICAPSDETKAGWLPVQTVAGQSGYIKATTKITTHEQVMIERLKLRRNGEWGRRQMFIGAGIFLLGIVLTIASFFLSSERETTIFVFTGAIVAGAGEFFWGMQQIANARYTLKQFDILWQEALK